MGIRRGSITTGIIADGLVFNMDAANRASYVPNGTTSFNTLNILQSGSFENGIDFLQPPISASCWEFDGTDEYITVSSTLNLSTSHTISYWCNVSATSFSNIISGTGGSRILFNSPNKIYYYSEGYTNTQPTVSTPLNQWNNVIISRDSTTIRFYVNGSLKTTTTGFGGNHFTFNKISGLDVDNQLASMHFYNRGLSSTEVLHNYNALKGRFGL